MIAKEVARGAGFRGAIAYVEDVDKHEIGFTDSRNLVHDDARGIAREMRAVAFGSHRVKKPVRHFVLSWQPDEVVDQAAMTESADRLLARLELDDRQARFVMHDEKGHKHLHLVVNSVGPDGRCWNPKQSKNLTIEAGRAVAREMGFHVVERDLAKERDPARPRPVTAREQRIEERTGRAPLRDRAGDTVARALKSACTWQEAHDLLGPMGYEIVEYADPKNPRRAGLSLVHLGSGETCKLSAFGSAYGRGALEKRLGSFSPPGVVCAIESAVEAGDDLLATVAGAGNLDSVDSPEAPSQSIHGVSIEETRSILDQVRASALDSVVIELDPPAPVEARVRANPFYSDYGADFVMEHFGERLGRDYSRESEIYKRRSTTRLLAETVLSLVDGLKDELTLLAEAGISVLNFALAASDSFYEKFEKIRTAVSAAVQEWSLHRGERPVPSIDRADDLADHFPGFHV